MHMRLGQTFLTCAALAAGSSALAQQVPAPPFLQMPAAPAPVLRGAQPNPTQDPVPDLTRHAPSHATPGGIAENAAFWVPHPNAADGAVYGVPPAPWAGPVPIAGLTPSQRPAGAPVLIDYPRSPEWYTRALHGVSEPYPAGLRFLDDIGGWWNAFIHPGMVGPYDIRGWHQDG